MMATRSRTRLAGESLFRSAQKNCLRMGKGRRQRGSLSIFFPVDVFAVKTVTGLGVGGELGTIDRPVHGFADALPEIAGAAE